MNQGPDDDHILSALAYMRQASTQRQVVRSRASGGVGSVTINLPGIKDGDTITMSQPSKDDPLGMKPDPTSFTEMVDALINAKVEDAVRWRTSTTGQDLRGITDMQLVQELLARGWAVFRPKSNEG